MASRLMAVANMIKFAFQTFIFTFYKTQTCVAMVNMTEINRRAKRDNELRDNIRKKLSRIHSTFCCQPIITLLSVVVEWVAVENVRRKIRRKQKILDRSFSSYFLVLKISVIFKFWKFVIFLKFRKPLIYNRYEIFFEF